MDTAFALPELPALPLEAIERIDARAMPPFGYHTKEKALVCLYHLGKSGRPYGVKISTLAAYGWRFNTDAAERLLPPIYAPGEGPCVTVAGVAPREMADALAKLRRGT